MSAEAQSIGTLARGLELLRMVNLMHPVRVSELSLQTGLHKATVSRLLATLCDLGYVSHDLTGTFSPRYRARELSLGIDANEWVREVVAPELDRLALDIQWPSDFALFQGRGMTIVHTTRATAPINHIRPPVNVRNISVFDSDFGRAFLAFSEPSQRQRLLEILSRSYRLEGQDTWNRKGFLDVLKQTQDQRYAIRSPHFQFAGATTISIPVILDKRAIGAFNIVVSGTSGEKMLAENYLERMWETSATISARLKLGDFDEVSIVK